MSRDYEPISTDGRQGPGIRVLLAIAIVAFLGGILLTGWVATRYDFFDRDGAATPVGTHAVRGEAATAASAAGQSGSALKARVVGLEERLARINVQAEAASGNAARAEGLLIAFATRRAIEHGRPLGYLDQQLQLRFVAANPEAVRTIRQFATDPVQLDQLQARLKGVGDDLHSEAGHGFFDRMSRELSELLLVRRQGTPSTASSARIKRAQRLAEAGNIRGTIAEVEKLPTTTETESWLADARRYQAAQDALEAMEMSAIFEPQGISDSYGAPVNQASPVAASPVRPAVPDAAAAPATDRTVQPAPAASTPASGRAAEDENFFGF